MYCSVRLGFQANNIVLIEKGEDAVFGVPTGQNGKNLICKLSKIEHVFWITKCPVCPSSRLTST